MSIQCDTHSWHPRRRYESTKTTLLIGFTLDILKRSIGVDDAQLTATLVLMWPFSWTMSVVHWDVFQLNILSLMLPKCCEKCLNTRYFVSRENPHASQKQSKMFDLHLPSWAIFSVRLLKNFVLVTGHMTPVSSLFKYVALNIFTQLSSCSDWVIMAFMRYVSVTLRAHLTMSNRTLLWVTLSSDLTKLGSPENKYSSQFRNMIKN